MPRFRDSEPLAFRVRKTTLALIDGEVARRNATGGQYHTRASVLRDALDAYLAGPPGDHNPGAANAA